MDTSGKFSEIGPERIATENREPAEFRILPLVVWPDSFVLLLFLLFSLLGKTAG